MKKELTVGWKCPTTNIHQLPLRICHNLNLVFLGCEPFFWIQVPRFFKLYYKSSAVVQPSSQGKSTVLLQNGLLLLAQTETRPRPRQVENARTSKYPASYSVWIASHSCWKSFYLSIVWPFQSVQRRKPPNLLLFILTGHVALGTGSQPRDCC